MVASVRHIACLGYLIKQVHDAPDKERRAIMTVAQSILGIRTSEEASILKEIIAVWPRIETCQASFDAVLKLFQERIPELDWLPPKDSVEGMMLAQIEKSQ